MRLIASYLFQGHVIKQCQSLVARVVSSEENDHLIQRSFALVCIGLSGAAMFWVLYSRWRTTTQKWFEGRNIEYDNSVIEQWCNVKHPGQESLCARLAEQAGLAQVRTAFHFDLFSHYASEHFASLSVAFFAAVLAAACLAFISKEGWKNTHNTITMFFIGFSILLAFFRGFPYLAQHEQNIHENERLYLEHMNLRQEIRSYCATGKVPEEAVELEDYVVRIDAKLRELNRVPLEFDASKVDVGATSLMEAPSE